MIFSTFLRKLVAIGFQYRCDYWQNTVLDMNARDIIVKNILIRGSEQNTLSALKTSILLLEGP